MPQTLLSERKVYRCIFKVSFYFRGILFQRSVDEINVLSTLFLQIEVSINPKVCRSKPKRIGGNTTKDVDESNTVFHKLGNISVACTVISHKTGQQAVVLDHHIFDGWAEIGRRNGIENQLVLRSTYQIFDGDRNNSDQNFYNVVRYFHIPLVP